MDCEVSKILHIESASISKEGNGLSIETVRDANSQNILHTSAAE